MRGNGMGQHPDRICGGTEAGGYAAFPDVCRTREGELLCAFYSGAGHVTMPSETWPRGGRIMAVRSADEGRTWGRPVVIADTPEDDRDPSLICLPDGTLLMNWFSLTPADPPSARVPWAGVHLWLARSTDSGHTWSAPEELPIASEHSFACSSPVRRLPDGALLLGLYRVGEGLAFGATVRSEDGGKTWTDLALIGEDTGLDLDAETDVVALNDGRLLAALRCSGEKSGGLYFAESGDLGRTWGQVTPAGFAAHCPYFLRHRSGVILLGCRLVRPTSAAGDQTAVLWSVNEGATWNGPVTVDGDAGGAYPSLVEVADGEVFCVYYEEGAGSSIRGKRLRVTPQAVEVIPAHYRFVDGFGVSET